MEEFLRSYGIWILLAAIFVGMQWFGAGCCGRHRSGSGGDEAAARPSEEKKPTVRQGGCH